jgi:tetratricopeptide (TPR) repeat protein
MECRDWPRAVPFLKEIIAASEELGEKRLTAVNLGNLGECLLELGELPEARAAVAVGLAIHREFNWSMGIADTLWNLSRIMRAFDRMAEARVLGRIAVLHRDRGNRNAARDSYELSIDISRETGDRWYLALSLERFAEITAQLGRYREARAGRAEALELFKDFD